MFRLFRRGKKDKKKDKIKDKSESDSAKKVNDKTDSVPIQTPSDNQIPILEDAPIDTTYAEKIVSFSKTLAESTPELIPEKIPEESEAFQPITEFPSIIKAVVESETSIMGFISPELLSQKANGIEAIADTYKHVELVPISLEERIEGAMFSIGRPIHTSELIENLQEESPLLKRTLRKLSKTRKRTAPIIFQEISKDRWVLQLNPIYHEFFHSLVPENFMTAEERRIVTEIAYRQPISIAMIKKIVKGIGPIKITEICQYLEKTGYVVSEKKARSLVYTTLPKFANDFGFDDETRRLKLQMLWRLKRLMGDYDAEKEEEEEEEEKVQQTEDETEEIKETEEEEMQPEYQEQDETYGQKEVEVATSLEGESKTHSSEKEEELTITDPEGELEGVEDPISSMNKENVIEPEEISSPENLEEE